MKRLSMVVCSAFTLTACALLAPHSSALDQGITGPVHQAHMGGILFSKHAVIPGKEDPNALSEHCTLGEGCYGTFYLSHSLDYWTHTHFASALTMRVAVDGQPPLDQSFSMADTQSVGQINLVRSKDDNRQYIDQSKWFIDNVVSKLSSGDHQIDIQILATPAGTVQKDLIAKAALTFTMPANSDAQLEKEQAHEGAVVEARESCEEPNVYVKVSEYSVCSYKYWDDSTTDAHFEDFRTGCYPVGTKIHVCQTDSRKCRTYRVRSARKQSFDVDCSRFY